jgi:hypothetical protein
MNCLYASHIHEDISVYHAFMHTVGDEEVLWCSQESQHGEQVCGI